MGRVNGDDKAQGALKRPIVAVIGASSADETALNAAEELGREVAAAGWHLMCGGGGGVMEAACRGFVSVNRSERGMTIGVLPSDDDRWANRHVEIPIATGMGYARNAIIARAASAVVVVGGCSGTLSEMALAWQAGRPMVAMAGTGGWAERLAGQAVDDRRADMIFSARTVGEAMAFLEKNLPRQ